MTYEVAKLPLNTLIGPVARATEPLARLDERLARSPVREGWIERQHFADATAALWLEGELVHVEDLVLHDAHMDIRAPTHELTRAHAVLRSRRQIFARPPDWALGREGIRQLTGRGRAGPAEMSREGEGSVARQLDAGEPIEVDEPDPLREEIAAIDAVLERATKVLDGGAVPARKEAAPQPDRPALVYDLDWDEDARLTEWQDLLDETRQLPVVLRAAILLETWSSIEVLQHASWLGPVLVSALLRQEGLAGRHLASLHLGTKSIPRERRRARNRDDRLLACIDAIQEAALAGLKEHDRLVLAKSQMERRLRERRSSSKLPDLVEFVMSRPLVSTGMIQDRLKVSKQGALNLVGELGLREMTGRGRFRAWGIV
ncbi:RHE_PE00001 family protein [Mesorhizobium sp. VK4C]|uniref:RHE_PE00001 family protein n=1 Tax=Mesorhizobium captivum TaxID=3072319 RepID=UPI002A249725|nr:RHE_PE00001 family protein [Mesorhizobium sp. VK4C]MDX8500875.1 RHE_PE00001 family protein [Mesorhizobium sp. VK4C]